MAIVDVKVPQFSESVSEGTLLQWKRKPGESVARDEVLVEIETDKVVLEVPAPEAGVLTEQLVHDGDTVLSEQLLAKIDTEAKASASAAPAATAAAAPASASTVASSASSTSVGAPASPAANKLMAEKTLSADQIQGTGRDGRITKGDVLSANGLAPAKVAPAVAPAAPAPRQVKPSLPDVKAPATAETWINNRPEQRVPMSRLRQRIAERLLESQQTNAILTTFNEVNMAPVMELRNKYKDRFEKEHGVKLGFMSFFVKAAVHALKKFPLVNASIDGTDVVYHGYFDIGIAVGSPRGLVVPILRNADQMSLADIEKKIAEFGQKAKDGKLSIDEMTGGTFSISNGGVFGSMLSTPIINPPQSAILGVHATKERPVVENGQIVIRPMNYLALSYDHRIIDGREAVLSLVAMKDALEDPARLLLDL
ncbi:MAG TPA: 2-oxoglutarate dehydrogenase complex dihydrolipoyllysine-residue succinyltransferase [Trinickia sp.]|jgi:2-oxoglutarate dehydrogenase E2 component (dihydrolipoamide succinyltransferase)|uniref:2-oxoglutarate dehydrogenase complex dihydrolipoyllysine-residue succinyltransferase n=1 Tax=Trinickia sp. TaxID=2571163 RepID=UPI002C8252CB|nr:2-oxoglutarate dehydrogenase complex dihydrolipoyllysine-residue succinyltransferase [Trinickia sp.]HTI18762.1 2-oxoglutarate dehydrogenase complex dihydrolipoyllysine-residue succinyltransferase [Trinickia sp.]